MAGTFIQSNDGELIEVADLDTALSQAKECSHWHDLRKIEKKNNPNVLYFPKAHAYWIHVLLQLEKLKLKLKANETNHREPLQTKNLRTL